MAKAKFDIKSEATRGLYAGAGVADLAVETVREYVTEVQTRFAGVQKDVAGFDYSPQALRQQVNARVEALSKDAKARRAAAEARVAELRKEATTLVSENADTATDAYGDLVKRGETLVARIRRQEATKATTRSAKTTTSKAKTTSTQAHPEALRPRRGRLRPRHRPRRPRPPLRDRVGQAAHRARLAAEVRRLRGRPGRHDRVVPGA